MRAAFRELFGDAWVLPIAAAVAIVYSAVFVQNLVAVVRIGDRVMFLQPLLESLVILLAVLAAAALALRWTTRERPVDLNA